MRAYTLNMVSGKAERCTAPKPGLTVNLIVGLMLALMAASLPLYAQGVYVTRGANGPVFSDKPQPGAKEMQLPPLSVIPAQKMPQDPKVPDAAGNDAARDRAELQTPPQTAYGTFTILFPEQNGSVVANTGSFTVRLAVDPPLRLGEGHAFTIRLNGQPVGQRFTSTEFMFPPEFWDGEMPPINQRAQLDASIVDSAGRVIMNATPAVFLMRYTTALQRPHSLYPPPPPPPPVFHRPDAQPAPAAPTYTSPWKPNYPRELHPGSRTIVMPPGSTASQRTRSGQSGSRSGLGTQVEVDARTTSANASGSAHR